MSDNLHQEITETKEEIVSLKFIFFLLLDYWKSISLMTLSVAILSVIYALSLPNYYHSTALLKPSQSASGMSSMLSQYSGLASLAGITMPTDAQMDNPTLALEIIKSKDFFEPLYLDEEFLIKIVAVDAYSKSTKEVSIDSKIYDLANQKWVREPSELGNIKPSLQEAHELFLEENLIVSRDIKTGVVGITASHISPYIAQEMTFRIVNDLNRYMKNQQTDLAQKSKEYLEGQLSQTRYQEMQKVLAALLEKEMQTLLLSSITEAFVFDYLDKPRVPERKAGPVRSAICIYITILGGVLAIFITLLRIFVPPLLSKD
jgi:LPS O-antigen subunit length determinant protein (WzzB/FepE family)